MLPENPQYHHFVPRFLLRNFAVFKNPGKVVPKTSTKSKNRAPKPQKLTVLNLKSGIFDQGDVGDTFGIVDMYRDFKEAGRDQQKLERELSVLESAAGEIVARVKRVYDAGKDEVQLIRKDKDILRRFLFIMMYRNSTFAKRFETSREDYNSDDRELMLAYMDEKGFQTPRDVWFANIRAFLEVDLDGDGPKSLAGLTQRAYPMDARWFIAHMEAFFIAFCTPEKSEDEFLLTQNVYGVYEGPTSAGPWTDYHRFAPVSPKIMIVMRSLLLPVAGIVEEDETRQWLLELNTSQHPNPEKAGSFLQDIPISRARNNYSQVVNGKVEPLPTKMSRDKNVFYFPFFPLDHEYVQKINMICLENAYDTLAIVYKSPESLRVALEFYLMDKTPGFKVICPTLPDNMQVLDKLLRGTELLSHVRRDDKLLPYLKLLQKFAKQLGSMVEMEYNLIPGPGSTSDLKHNTIDGLRNSHKSLTDPVQKARSAKLGKSYWRVDILWRSRLIDVGETIESALWDMDQSKRIVQLIIKVDTSIKNCSGEVKRVVRQNREDLIASLTPRHVWLSVKCLRHIENSKATNQTTSFESNTDKEDVIVDGKHSILHIDWALLTFIANHIFKRDSLSRMIYRVFNIDHFLHQLPNFGLVNAFTYDEEGAKHTHQELELVFNKPGKRKLVASPAASTDFKLTQR